MSTQIVKKRITVPDIRKKKRMGEKIVSLTAYYAYSARIADPYCDFLLVGDSLGMVVYGMDSTLGVTLDMMIAHGKAVVQATTKALIVVDMPFGSYEQSPEQAFQNASRIMRETGCAAVKLEGGKTMASTIRFLKERGIPVMGHVGLTPQSVNVLGGFKAQGRKHADWEKIEQDAKAVEEAGAFAIVLEGVVEPLAQRITQAAQVPVIGIGASRDCDGQILVMEDMLGYVDWAPKFVRQYAHLGQIMDAALRTYAEDVQSGTFPSEIETYRIAKNG